MAKKDPSIRATAETITPLNLSLKKRGNGKDLLQRRHHLGIILMTCAIAGLIAAGVWLLVFLSENPRQPLQTTIKPPATEPVVNQKPVLRPAPPPPSAPDHEQLASNKEEAERKLAEFLAVKNGLAQMGVQAWGSAAYTRMTQLGNEADSHFMGHEYNAAAAKYDRAAVIAGELTESAPEVLHRLLNEGEEALKKGAGGEAQKKFSAALMIDPSNASAQHGLKRAGTIEAVMQLIESGRQQEESGRLDAAKSDYEKALQMDPDAKRVQTALNRVMGRIKEEQFRLSMSAGLTALNNNDYRQARSHLLKARSYKPESREVSDALSQLDQAVRLSRIDKLRREAQAAEESENWQAALKSYLAVLDIDNNLRFAARGKEQAMEQIQIDSRLQFFLDKPQLLESDSQLDNALRLIDEAKTVKPQGSKRTARIRELEALVAVAQTTVKVTIESDNLTRIAVYKVGRLGRFTTYDLELRPGTYTVVGARDGYQDVREKIVVKPGQQAVRVTIKCRVKI
jgi:tetratricopeptide (TPR) repeat protein